MVKKTVFRGIFLAYLCGMEILDGKLVSQAVKNDLKTRVAEMISAGGKKPHLAAILVGNNGASETYVASKVKSCEEVGFTSTLIRLEDTIGRKRIVASN